jgi:hypothetical protein
MVPSFFVSKKFLWPQKTQETQKGVAEIRCAIEKQKRFQFPPQISATPFCVSCVVCG